MRIFLGFLAQRPSAFLPVAMSVAALSIVAARIAMTGTVPQPDEGAAAHLWQLLMAAQLPVTAFFVVKWLPKAPRQALSVLAVQVAAACASFAPVFLLKW